MKGWEFFLVGTLVHSKALGLLIGVGGGDVDGDKPAPLQVLSVRRGVALGVVG